MELPIKMRYENKVKLKDRTFKADAFVTRSNPLRIVCEEQMLARFMSPRLACHDTYSQIDDGAAPICDEIVLQIICNDIGNEISLHIVENLFIISLRKVIDDK
jgi:hypothetical protein